MNDDATWIQILIGLLKDVQHVTTTTKQTIRKAVREGLDANEGSAQIAKRVEDIYSDKWK